MLCVFVCGCTLVPFLGLSITETPCVAFSGWWYCCVVESIACRSAPHHFAGMQHAAATAMAVQEVLAGCADPDPAAHGMTSEEERSASNVQVGPASGVVIAPERTCNQCCAPHVFGFEGRLA
jgi:hypothetical protein